MKGIIFNTYQKAQDLVDEIDNTFNALYKGATRHFSEVKKHPTLSKWCVPVEMKQVIQMQEQFADLLNSLSKTVDDLVELDSTWFQYPELDV